MWLADFIKAGIRRYANVVSNGNIANGTTGWNAVGGTLSALNNVLTITGNGTDADVYPRAFFTAITGHKYYVIYDMRVTNSVCSYLRLNLFDFGASVTAPTENNWYTISDIRTATYTAVQVQLRATYSTAVTANGKVSEIKNVRVVDLTEYFGAGAEPTKEWCDANVAPNVVY